MLFFSCLSLQVRFAASCLVNIAGCRASRAATKTQTWNRTMSVQTSFICRFPILFSYTWPRDQSTARDCALRITLVGGSPDWYWLGHCAAISAHRHTTYKIGRSSRDWRWGRETGYNQSWVLIIPDPDKDTCAGSLHSTHWLFFIRLHGKKRTPMRQLE